MNYIMSWPTSYSVAAAAGPAALKGKISIVTGCNAGIGLETAAALSDCGGTVVMACRNTKAAQEAAAANASLAKNKDRVVIMKLDLGSLESIASFCAQFASSFPQGCDRLVLNAGLGYNEYATVFDGLAEQTIGVNHIAHFYLTKLLLDGGKINDNGRIVVVASDSHREVLTGPDTLRADIGRSFNLLNQRGLVAMGQQYRLSKLANVLFANKLHRIFAEQKRGIVVNSLHPGSLIQTSFGKVALTKVLLALTSLFTMSPAQGAATQTYLAVSPATAAISGEYYAPSCVKSRCTRQGADVALQDALWAWTEAFVDGAAKQAKAKL